jgi:hypothetical protein
MLSKIICVPYLGLGHQPNYSTVDLPNYDCVSANGSYEEEIFGYAEEIFGAARHI